MRNKGIISFFSVLAMVLASCGPVVISSRPDYPPPPWFYPHRLEVVRYVYFPEFTIYYDLTARNYLYLDNGVWVRVNVLPPPYQHLDLRRSRYVRIRDYTGDNIRQYHDDRNANRGRSNTDSSRGRVN